VETRLHVHVGLLIQAANQQHVDTPAVSVGLARDAFALRYRVKQCLLKDYKKI